MASWTTPKSFVAGAALTAAELNEQIRDNETWLKDAASTHGITSDTAIGQLKSAVYGVQAYNTSNQATTSGNTLTLVFPSETFDSDTLHDTSTNTNRLTVPSGGDGIYLCGYTVEFAANSSGDRRATFTVNGTPVDWGRTRGRATSANTTVLSTSAIWHGATAGDYLTLTAIQTSGGALNIEDAYFWMVRLFAS